MNPSPKKSSKRQVKKVSEEVRKNPEVQTVLEIARISQGSENSRLKSLEKSYPNFFKF